MGILQKIGKALGGILLVFAIMALLTINALVAFTEYDTLKPVFIDVIQAQAKSQAETIDIDVGSIDDELYQFISGMCEGQDTVTVPLEEIGGFGGLNAVTIDCDNFRDEPAMGRTTMDYIVDEIGEDFFDEFYYQEYDCEFMECVNTGKFTVIMSDKGHKYFSSLRIWPWVFIAVSVVIIFLSTDNWTGFLKSLGWSMAFLGVSYVIMGAVTDGVVKKMPNADMVEQAGIDIMTPINTIVQPIVDGLLYVFVLGVTLLAIGYGIEFYQKRRGKAVDKPPAKRPDKEKPQVKPKPRPKPKQKPKTPPVSKSVPQTFIDWD